MGLLRCPAGGQEGGEGLLDGPLLGFLSFPLDPGMEDLVQVGEGVLHLSVTYEDHRGLLHVGLAKGRFPQGPLGKALSWLSQSGTPGARGPAPP